MPANSDNPCIRRLRLAMGSWVAIEASTDAAEQTLIAVDGAYAAVLEVERLMHPTRDGSDIARINSAIAGEELQVHTWSFWLLSICQQLCALSDGYFDPGTPAGVGSVTTLRLRSPDKVGVIRPLHLDLGGIAKGFAVDRAIETLIAAGCTKGLVNAGGDLRVCGSEPQRVLVRTRASQPQSLLLCNQSLAVSDPEAADHPPEYLGYYSRRPDATAANGPIAVIAPTATTADALTKALRFMNEGQRLRLLEQCQGQCLSWPATVELEQ